ncbi:MAG: diguanylate cyclase [Thiotrichales bacterium]|nr:diguanylate cyclase [Thiotrichales bacterium]
MLDFSIYMKALESTRDGLVITKTEGRNNIVVYVNPAYSKLTGYERAEVLGRDNRFLQGCATTQEEKKRMRIAIDNGEPLLITLQNYKKDGTPFWNELSLSPITNDQRIIEYYIGIQKDVTERVELNQKLIESNRTLELLNLSLKEQNKLDALTQLYNRTVLNDKAQLLFEIVQREQNFLSVFFIDIDKFKNINDLYGHKFGDAGIQSVAKAIKTLFKRPSDLAIRYGGEEFLVVTYGNTPEESQLLAEHLRKQIETTKISMNNQTLSLTLSIGLFCCIPESTQTLDSIIQQADLAMYAAKHNGRNQVQVALCDKLPK